MLKVDIPETLSCCSVRLVAVVIPNVEIPETLSCCSVRLVAVVIPNVEIPETLSCCKVLIPETTRVVAPMPPLTWRVCIATVVPTPTLLVTASATIRFVDASKPFFTTKFLLTDIGFHSPPLIVLLFI